MKRKKNKIDELDLMSSRNMSQIRGGERTRLRAADGSKLKVISKD